MKPLKNLLVALHLVRKKKNGRVRRKLGDTETQLSKYCYICLFFSVSLLFEPSERRGNNSFHLRVKNP